MEARWKNIWPLRRACKIHWFLQLL